MKTTPVIAVSFHLATLLPLLGASAVAADSGSSPTTDERSRLRQDLQQIAAESDYRRTMIRTLAGEPLAHLDEARAYRSKVGTVYQPIEMPDPDMRITLALSNVPVGIAAEFYAVLSHKEVMVSSRLARRTVSVVIPGLSPAEARSRLESAFSEAAIVAEQVGSSIVVLTDLPLDGVDPERANRVAGVVGSARDFHERD